MPKAMARCDKIGKSAKGGEVKHLTSLKPTATYELFSHCWKFKCMFKQGSCIHLAQVWPSFARSGMKISANLNLRWKILLSN